MKKFVKEISAKTIPELEKQSRMLREDLARLVLNQKVNPAKDTNAVIKKKKELAVMLTVLTQKKYEKNIDR